jgi:hypothetical protein
MATSSFKRRLAKIEGAVGRLVGKNPTHSLRGCIHDAIWDAVEAAIDPADHDVGDAGKLPVAHGLVTSLPLITAGTAGKSECREMRNAAPIDVFLGRAVV